MWHLVREVRNIFGDVWPRHVAILTSSNAESLQLINVQTQAKLIISVLCTQSHWAVLFCRRHQQKAVVVDGLAKKEIMDQAMAMILHVADHWQTQLELSVANVPKQIDGWSCAHRVIAASRAALALCLRHSATWPPELPPAIFDEVSLRGLCQSDPGKVTGKEPAVEAAHRQDAGVGSPAGPGTAALKKRARTPSKQQEANQKRHKVLADLHQHKLSFNEGFQVVHWRNHDAIGKGHYQQFVASIADGLAVECGSCQELMQQLSQRQAGVAETQPIADATGATAPVTHTPGFVSSHDLVTPAASAPVYSGRGRPHKDQGCCGMLWPPGPAVLKFWAVGNQYFHILILS